MLWKVCNRNNALINGVLWVCVITYRCGVDHVLGVDGLSLASVSSSASASANARTCDIAGGVVDGGVPGCGQVKVGGWTGKDDSGQVLMVENLED